MQFSKRLKELRKQQNITQSQLAQAIGVTDRACRRYESGENEPTLSIIMSIASYFNVSIDCLVGSGLYAKEDLILQNKHRLIEALDKFYYTDFFNKISQLSNNKFMEILSGIIDDIQISDEDGKLEISIYPLLASDAGKTLSKIVP